MGQTLTHGVYLPDEGERNCYNGLAANWQLLDGAVGTVAEHSTQIAGKAPLVHTHTKSDITDFPAYGNTAGTICEGNDSRLSDARTPVAHTHTKSDITNLFNSANTWSADQTLTSQAYIKSPTWEKGVEPSSATHRNIYFVDKNDVVVGTIRRRIANGSQSFQFFGSALIKDGQLDPTGDNVTWGFSQIFNSDGSTYFQFDGNIGNSIVPRLNNTYDLGSSTLKWKTINGVNPGALSFPSGNDADSIAVDITDWYIQDPDYPDDPTKKILDATNHKVDTAVPGWLHINFPNVAGNWAYARKYAAGNNMALQCIADGNASSDFANVALIFPIYSSCYVRIKAKTATVRIFPCLSNV